VAGSGVTGSGVDRVVPAAASEPFPLLICVLGDFRVLREGTPVPMRAGGKMAAILAGLAQRDRFHASREALLELLWPGGQVECATQSLNTLVHALRRQLGEALRGHPPIVRVDGGYRLNVGAGVMVDSVHFDTLTDAGERRMRAGDPAAAVGLYQRAVDVYQGDLCDGGDLRGLIERERLRSRYLSLLARIADFHFQRGAYPAALAAAQRLLLHDPCREDAHRLVMRCHARLGERAQALQQYRLCRTILEREFTALPEPATEALYTSLRLEPERV
jgi:DNA-binding SARP family transcriptional activator